MINSDVLNKFGEVLEYMSHISCALKCYYLSKNTTQVRDAAWLICPLGGK